MSNRYEDDSEFGLVTSGVHIETDKDAQISRSLIDPHYTDHRFDHPNGALTVFLDPGHKTKVSFGTEFVEEAGYNYDDRLMQQYGYDAYQAAAKKAAGLVKNVDSARYFEEILRELYGKPETQLVHILTGVNRSNGYSYRVFGTINPTETQEQSSQ